MKKKEKLFGNLKLVKSKGDQTSKAFHSLANRI